MRIRPTLRSVFFGTLLYAAFMIIFRLIFDGIPQDGKGYAKLIIPAIMGGLIFSFIFGFLMDRFVSSGSVNQSLALENELTEGESVIFETGANHFRKAEGVGGKIYLTDKRLIFKAHKYNLQKYTASFSYSDINRVTKTKTLGLINNGLILQIGGNKEKFVVANRDILGEHLQKYVQAHHVVA